MLIIKLCQQCPTAGGALKGELPMFDFLDAFAALADIVSCMLELYREYRQRKGSVGKE